MALNGIKKEWQIPGKGQNETLEIVNSLEHTMAVTKAADGHVPGNGGTCTDSHFVAGVNRLGSELVAMAIPRGSIDFAL
jgi:hypothetical protein